MYLTAFLIARFLEVHLNVLPCHRDRKPLLPFASFDLLLFNGSIILDSLMILLSRQDGNADPSFILGASLVIHLLRLIPRIPCLLQIPPYLSFHCSNECFT